MIVGVENEPPGSERGVNFSLFIPFVRAAAIQSDSLFLGTRQRPEHISDPEDVISSQQRLNIQRTHSDLQKAKESHICREILITQTTSSVGG